MTLIIVIMSGYFLINFLLLFYLINQDRNKKSVSVFDYAIKMENEQLKSRLEQLRKDYCDLKKKYEGVSYSNIYYFKSNKED